MLARMSGDVALGAGGGVVVGLLAGFIIAVLQLQAKRWRNARLVRANRPPYRDCILINWHLPGAIGGGLFGGVLALWWSPTRAALAGGMTVPALVLLVSLGAVVLQLQDETSGD